VQVVAIAADADEAARAQPIGALKVQLLVMAWPVRR
jgi:hypothetical protein